MHTTTDSGAPIVLAGTNIQIGVNSFSNGNCETQTLDVYTRVSYYHDWIQAKICDNSQSASARAVACAGGATAAPTPAPTTPSMGGGDDESDTNTDGDDSSSNRPILDWIAAVWKSVFG